MRKLGDNFSSLSLDTKYDTKISTLTDEDLSYTQLLYLEFIGDIENGILILTIGYKFELIIGNSLTNTSSKKVLFLCLMSPL